MALTLNGRKVNELDHQKVLIGLHSGLSTMLLVKSTVFRKEPFGESPIITTNLNTSVTESKTSEPSLRVGLWTTNSQVQRSLSKRFPEAT